MTLRGLLAPFWRFLTGQEPPSPREALADMYKGLEIQGDATSFAMARADDLYERLETEITNNEALNREAENFLREGNQEAAQRCVTLRVQSDAKIEQLKSSYAEAQKDAEQKVVMFRKSQGDVEVRHEALPQIEEQQHIVAMGERIQKKLASFSMDNPQRAFDQAARELRVRERQLANRQLLATDPNAELDLRIRQAVGERKVAAAMEELRSKIAAEGDIIEGQVVKSVEIDHAAGQARQLLEAPRYSGLGVTTSTASRRQPVMVRQLSGGQKRT